MTITSKVAAPLAGLMTLLAACGTKEAPGPLEPSGPAARVRLVNVIADTTRGRVNAILEGLPFTVNLTYAQSAPANLPAPSTAPYASVLAGSRSFLLKRTADTNVTVASLPFSANANETVTVYAVGGAGLLVTAFVTRDSTSAPSGQARVRVVTLTPASGPVDVFITAPGADLAAATPTFTAMPFRTANYVSLPPGTYQLRVVPAGTAPGSRSSNVIITLASFTVASGAVRTIVTAENATGGAPLRAFVLTDF